MEQHFSDLRVIQYKDEVSRVVDMMCLYQMIHYHNHCKKLYSGSTTGTQLIMMGSKLYNKWKHLKKPAAMEKDFKKFDHRQPKELLAIITKRIKKMYENDGNKIAIHYQNS